jgi:DNA-binding response OmpR family regulator
VHEGRLDPGVDLLTKPFTQAALGEKLRDILDARAAPARVLLVEDEALVQMVATEYLQEAGLKVDVAASAVDALNKLRLVPGGVDAVIVDMGLPDRRGEDLVREIRSIYPLLPIIIASGQATQHLRRLFQDVESVSFLAKPYTEEELRAALRAVGIR